MSKCHPEPALAAGLLFNWLYPAHFPAILCCLEAWADTPEVTTAILKFAAEFVLNKAQRLTFDTSSPNGILLFREVSKVHWPPVSCMLACETAANCHLPAFNSLQSANLTEPGVGQHPAQQGVAAKTGQSCLAATCGRHVTLKAAWLIPPACCCVMLPAAVMPRTL